MAIQRRKGRQRLPDTVESFPIHYYDISNEIQFTMNQNFYTLFNILEEFLFQVNNWKSQQETNDSNELGMAFIYTQQRNVLISLFSLSI